MDLNTKNASEHGYMPLNDYGDILSVPDIATIFNVSKQTVYKEIKAGKFGEPIIIGRAYKVPKKYILQRYLENY